MRLLGPTWTRQAECWEGDGRVTGPEHLAVVAAGLGAGMLTSTVGVASLVSFPVLVALGIPPVVANASNTVGLIPGALSGSFGYRRELREVPSATIGSVLTCAGGSSVVPLSSWLCRRGFSPRPRRG